MVDSDSDHLAAQHESVLKFVVLGEPGVGKVCCLSSYLPFFLFFNRVYRISFQDALTRQRTGGIIFNSQTSLIHRYLNDRFSTDSIQTSGVEFHRKRISFPGESPND